MKAALPAIALLVFASTAGAQRLTEARSAASPILSAGPPSSPAGPAIPGATQSRNGAMALNGTVFAAGGIFAGAYIGADLACGGASADDWCELGGAIVGALVGEMIMLPLGVHLASDRSSYSKKLLVSSAVMLGGAILAPFTGGISLLAAPPIQLVTVMGIENRAVIRAAAP